MTERALLTDAEREQLRQTGELSLDERLNQLHEDLQLLATHQPALLASVRTALEEAERTAKETAETATLGELGFPHDDEQSKAAVYAARAYIRDNGPATRNEIVSAVLPMYALGFPVHERVDAIESHEPYDGAWWTDIVEPGLTRFPDIECVDGEWRHTGTNE